MLLLRPFVCFAVCRLTTWPAWATWSVIAVDRGTGMAVLASATCVQQLRSRWLHVLGRLVREHLSEAALVTGAGGFASLLVRVS